MGNEVIFDFDVAPMKVHLFTFPGQYGTHVDAPGHFTAGMRLVDEIDDDCAGAREIAAFADEVRGWRR